MTLYSIVGSVCVSLRSSSWPSLATSCMVHFGSVTKRSVAALVFDVYELLVYAFDVVFFFAGGD